MSRGVLLSVLLGTALAATGCSYTSADLPYASQSVYRAAVEEAMPMRPTRVEDESLHIFGDKVDLAGNEMEFEISVVPGFAENTSTINVRFEQVKPQQKRFQKWEQQFVDKIKARLQASSPAAGKPK
jgi:hypothetical protein